MPGLNNPQRSNPFSNGSGVRRPAQRGVSGQFNPSKGQNGSIQAGGGFTKGAAGGKSYGQGRPFPNMGKTKNKAGYGKRDATNRARADAIQKRLGGM